MVALKVQADFAKLNGREKTTGKKNRCETEPSKKMLIERRERVSERAVISPQKKKTRPSEKYESFQMQRPISQKQQEREGKKNKRRYLKKKNRRIPKNRGDILSARAHP